MLRNHHPLTSIINGVIVDLPSPHTLKNELWWLISLSLGALVGIFIGVYLVFSFWEDFASVLYNFYNSHLPQPLSDVLHIRSIPPSLDLTNEALAEAATYSFSQNFTVVASFSLGVAFVIGASLCLGFLLSNTT